MIHPSYNELIEAINANTEDNDSALSINSRYSLVLATSKRARQLIAGAEPLVKNAEDKKPLAIAIEELYKGKVRILEDYSEEEEKAAEIGQNEDAAEDAGDAEAEYTEEENAGEVEE